ncbi:MAG: hypothetical protein VKP62_16620 [Candidatus Sericytochromatia bacterium]|nr:hypothetical protein [Candidatus Sericytochromatia bacterium]
MHARAALLALGLLSWPLPGAASSLPPSLPPDQAVVGAGLGLGVHQSSGAGLALEWRGRDPWQLGLACALDADLTRSWNLRARWHLVEPTPQAPGFAAAVGLWGRQGGDRPGPLLRPFLGFSLEQRLWDRLALRLSLGYAGSPAPDTPRTALLSEGAQAGVELGYRLAEAIELTLGWNGQGELVGLKFFRAVPASTRSSDKIEP